MMDRPPDLAKGQTPSRPIENTGEWLPTGSPAYTQDGDQHHKKIHIAPEWTSASWLIVRQSLQEVSPLSNALDFSIVLDREQRATQEEQSGD